MIEKDIEKYLVKEVVARGGAVRKAMWIGRRGAPDRLVLFPGDHFFVELKIKKGVISTHQKMEHEALRRAGFRVYIWRTIEEINKYFNEKN